MLNGKWSQLLDRFPKILFRALTISFLSSIKIFSSKNDKETFSRYKYHKWFFILPHAALDILAPMVLYFINSLQNWMS
ncbi:hypothetical protein NQ317_004749 [Molorchus minor]|uniref:Uncharacterized protein n=1 Tax=Molorchus minor TaxID=1323400 RepID=A0ABQ9IZ84_9CUCU|nr:hypothetical protein NQ317_004749 [Molorchus minor]